MSTMNAMSTTIDFDEAITRYQPVMGLEVHVELNTATKMFCGCGTAFGADPNTQTCPVCLGLPGALPVVNAAAVESAIRIGLALNCSIARECRFARKNYFYPDMPKNYQTSQYDEPICYDGWIDVDAEGPDGQTHTYRIEIERAHMEEDTGKATHVGGESGRIHGASHSLLDFNRAGIPLIEIVTRTIDVPADIAPALARAYVHQLRDLIGGLGVSDVRMDQGSLRADVNLSLKAADASAPGTRTETKNVNSFRSVERAVRHEVSRHAAVLDAGQQIHQETRHFHEESGATSPGREKTDAADYRYFPDPDLPPVAPDPEWVERLRAEMPEPPAHRRARLQAAWGFNDLDMRDTVGAGALDLVAATVDAGASPGAAKKWWLGELARRANEQEMELAAMPIAAGDVARLQKLIDDGKINDKIAREVIGGILEGDGTPEEIVSDRGLELVSDDSALATAVDQAIAENPDAADKVRGGKTQAAGALIGVVMKQMRGQADAQRVRELVLERLDAG